MLITKARREFKRNPTKQPTDSSETDLRSPEASTPLGWRFRPSDKKSRSLAIRMFASRFYRRLGVVCCHAGKPRSRKHRWHQSIPTRCGLFWWWIDPFSVLGQTEQKGDFV